MKVFFFIKYRYFTVKIYFFKVYGSCIELQEVIMMLEQCTKDFRSLIQRLQLLEAYDNAEEGQK